MTDRNLSDPLGALPYAQLTEAIDIVYALARQEVLIGSLPVAVDEFNVGLDALRRRVISTQQACAWSDYRKAYGVNEKNLHAAHKAFIAGWEAGQGKSFEEGPVR